MIAALSAEDIVYVADDDRPDVQTFQVVAQSREHAAERVSLALDRQLVSYGTLAVEG